MKRLSLLFIAAVMVLSACAPQAPAATEPPAAPAEVTSAPVDAATTPQEPTSAPVEAVPQVVTRALASEPAGLDPAGAAGAGQNVILPYLFDTLAYRDNDNSYKPFLAEGWVIEGDGKVITFTLRQGIKFHDGTPLNAEAVKYSFERAMQAGGQSPTASGLTDVETIEAVDDVTVRFTFKQPSAAFFSTISTPYAGIVSPAAIEKSGDQFPQQPVGSGPYMLSAWEPGVSVTLTANPDYAWAPPSVTNQGKPSIETLVFKVIPDATAQLNAFQAGEIDVLFVNNPGQMARLSGDASANIVETTLNSLIYLGFNTRKAPFDQLAVRQALSHAVNKTEILKLAIGGIGEEAHTPLPPTLTGYDESLQEFELAYDPAEVEQLLTEAGYTRQADGSWVDAAGETLKFSLLTSTRPPNEAIATVLQSQFQAMGIPMEIRQLESAAAMEAATTGDYDIMLWRYDWNDPDVLNTYLSSARIGRTNRQFYSNPELDNLLAQAAVEMNDAARIPLYRQAQQIILQDAPWQPLYVPKDYTVVSNRVQGVVFGPMGRLLMNDATVVAQP